MLHMPFEAYFNDLNNKILLTQKHYFLRKALVLLCIQDFNNLIKFYLTISLKNH